MKKCNERPVQPAVSFRLAKLPEETDSGVPSEAFGIIFLFAALELDPDKDLN